jgi:formylglycine-generating enzyme required for sulfatase activity
MPNVFISYSRKTKETALRLRRDLQLNGITDIFLDLDPIDGLPPGSRWADELERQIKGSKAVVLLVGLDWIKSAACRQELSWAHQGRTATRSNSPALLPILLPDVTFDDLAGNNPAVITEAGAAIMAALKNVPDAQVAAVRGLAALNARQLRVSLEAAPDSQRHDPDRLTADAAALLASQTSERNRLWEEYLQPGLAAAGVVPQRVAFRNDQKPYPGLAALQEEDAPVFFGRESEVDQLVEILSDMRGRRSSNMLVIQAASGAGKSSLLRAGLLSRLKLAHASDFYCLPTLTPGRAAMSDPGGFIDVLARAFDVARNYPARLYDDPNTNIAPKFPRLQGFELVPKRTVQRIVEAGVDEIERMMLRLQDIASPLGRAGTVVDPVTLILPIDQAEELFPLEPISGEVITAKQRDRIEEANLLRTLLSDLLAPRRRNVNLIVVLAIRSDSFPRLQEDADLGSDITKRLFDLSPLPIANYSAVIEKPAELAKVTIEPQLVQRLLEDLEGLGDALPLLAFVMRRLYDVTENNKPMALKRNIELDDYAGDKHQWSLGGMQGAIERVIRAALLNSGLGSLDGAGGPNRALQAKVRDLFIGSLVSVDPDTKQALRRIAEDAEIQADGRQIADALVAARILVRNGEAGSYQVAHEAVLRQWERLSAWISESVDAIGIVSNAERRAKEWWQTRGLDEQSIGVVEHDRTFLPEQDNVDEILLALKTINRRIEALPAHFAAYLGAEVDRLQREIEVSEVSHLRRAQIGDRFDGLGTKKIDDKRIEFGDPRWGVNVLAPGRIAALSTLKLSDARRRVLEAWRQKLKSPASELASEDTAGVPDIVWCKVPSGPVTIQRDEAKLKEWAKQLPPGADPSELPVADPFETVVESDVFIARFPITLAQFMVFSGRSPADAHESYRDLRWWEGLHATPNPASPDDPMSDPGRFIQEQSTAGNYPAQYVTWYQAVAYCRWLTDLYRRHGVIPGTAEIRLPFEAEWLMAATGGTPRRYPWGNRWDTSLCSNQDGANRFVATGLYPLGASPVGAMDMSGNVYEWCLDAYDDLGNPAFGEERSRATRGGSYYTQGMNRPTAHAVSVYHRFKDNPWGLTGARDNDRSTRIAAGLRPVCVGLDPNNPLIAVHGDSA